jgi:hypothetical protein
MFVDDDDDHHHHHHHHHHHNMYKVTKLSAESSILTVYNAVSIHSCRCAGVQTISYPGTKRNGRLF